MTERIRAMKEYRENGITKMEGERRESVRERACRRERELEREREFSLIMSSDTIEIDLMKQEKVERNKVSHNTITSLNILF